MSELVLCNIPTYLHYKRSFIKCIINSLEFVHENASEVAEKGQYIAAFQTMARKVLDCYTIIDDLVTLNIEIFFMTGSRPVLLSYRAITGFVAYNGLH